MNPYPRHLAVGQVWFRPNLFLGPPHRHEERRIISIIGDKITYHELGGHHTCTRREFWARIWRSARLAMPGDEYGH
jgi:hypothetical protein